MSEEDVRKEIQRLNDLYIKENDKKILYSREVVDSLIFAKTNKLQQENQQLKKDYAQIVSDNCDYLKLEQQRNLYKSVIEEVREYIDTNTKFEHDGDDYGYTEWVNIKPQNIVFINELLEILDKSKENK